MRRWLVLPGLLAAAFAAATPAVSQNYPWCSNFADGWGGTNCGFSTLEQCMATVHGAGGFCTENNTYVPPTGAASARHTARKRAPHKN
jgi:hypothetical protein